MDKYQQAFEKLLGDVLGLYFNGAFTQFGLDEQQALEIVSGITHLSKERLVELKQTRDNQIAEVLANSYELFYDIGNTSKYFKDSTNIEPINIRGGKR